MSRMVYFADGAPMEPAWRHLPFFDIAVHSINDKLNIDEYKEMIDFLGTTSSRTLRFQIPGDIWNIDVIRYFFDDDESKAVFRLKYYQLEYVTLPP
jgi:hypothetical protein